VIIYKDITAIGEEVVKGDWGKRSIDTIWYTRESSPQVLILM